MPPVTCGAGHPGHLHLDRPGPYAATPKRAPWPWAAQWCPGQPRRTLWPPLTQEPAPLSPPGTCWPSTPTPGRTHSLDSYCTARCGACGPPGTPSKSPISTPRVSTLCCGTRTTPSSSTSTCRKTSGASRPGSSDPMPYVRLPRVVEVVPGHAQGLVRPRLVGGLRLAYDLGKMFLATERT